jgi:dolichol-phosphate mannosyltransferase
MDLTILVPCYNETENVADMRAGLLPVAAALAGDREVELLFVDDGSEDGTYDELHEVFRASDASSVPVRIERHTVNRGLGAALRTGTAAARGAVVVSTDSDGTYEFADIPRLLSYLTSETDIVTASALHPDGRVIGVPRHRMILSRGVSFLYRLLVSPRVYTYTCLFRAYRREVLDRVSWESDDFLGVTELLVRAMLMGYRATEVPATLRPRARGTSKVRLARTIYTHLRFLSRLVLHRLRLVPLVEPRRVRATRGTA